MERVKTRQCRYAFIAVVLVAVLGQLSCVLLDEDSCLDYMPPCPSRCHQEIGTHYDPAGQCFDNSQEVPAFCRGEGIFAASSPSIKERPDGEIFRFSNTYSALFSHGWIDHSGGYPEVGETPDACE